MAGGASFKDYSDAYTSVTRHKTIVPLSAQRKEGVPLRGPSAEAAKEERLEKQLRQVGDLMRKVEGFLFLTCACGLKLKIPPNYKRAEVACPRCNRVLALPAR